MAEERKREFNNPLKKTTKFIIKHMKNWKSHKLASKED